MRIVLVALALALASGPAAGQDHAHELLAAGDFRGALQALEAEPEGVHRQDGLAELYYRASDPARALAAAEQGLALDPRQWNLLYRAAASAVWLGDGRRALAHLDVLAPEIEASSDLADADRAQWRSGIADLRARAEHDVTVERARVAAVARAHGLAWTVLVLAVVALLLALLAPLRPPRGTLGDAPAT